MKSEKKPLILESDKTILLYTLGLVTKLGVSVIVIIGIFLSVGYFIDQQFQTKILFSALFLILSIPVSLYNIYYLLRPIVGRQNMKKVFKVMRNK